MHNACGLALHQGAWQHVCCCCCSEPEICEPTPPNGQHLVNAAPPPWPLQDAPLVKPEPGIELQLAADEYASCDLTDDDAAPSWQVHKKPRIVLD
jgi:hypothetical protein